MRTIQFPLIFIYLFLNTVAYSQSITGKVMDELSGELVENIDVVINGETFTTGSDGEFRAVPKQADVYTLRIVRSGYQDYSIEIENDSSQEINLGILFLESDNISSQNRLEFDDIDLLQLDPDISSLLTASWDPFDSKAQFNFTSTRFVPRGMTRDHNQLFLNGLSFNNLDDGNYAWRYWGGLNDVFRSRYSRFGLNMPDYAVSGIAGAANINLRASEMRQGTRLTMSYTNRSYNYRGMITHSSGLQENGWAYSFSLSKRYGENGLIEGTYYDSYAYFASVEKRIGSKHALNMVVLGTPTVRGRGSGTTQFVYDLVDDNYYNPNWGLQNGRVRNSREYRYHQPIAIFSHDYTISDDTRLSTSLGYQTGHNGSTRLDWLEAADPRPDYYRKLPYENRDNPSVAQAIREQYQNDINTRQINWGRLYDINQNRQYLVRDPDGIDNNNYIENISAYVVENQRYDLTKLSLQSHVNHQINDRLAFKGGVQLINDKQHIHKVLDDLLGGSYYLDIDDFAFRDFPDDYGRVQNDLNNPNRLISEGDVFGYNYYLHNQSANFWSGLTIQNKKVDFTIGTEVRANRFWRDGIYRNGKFPEDSEGKSDVESFLNGTVKFGATYKIDGRNYVYANATYLSRAPVSRNSFVAPQIRNAIVSNLQNEKIFGGELGYILRYPGINARITGYYFDSNDATDYIPFYHDDLRSFINYTVENIDKINYGVELGADINLSKVLTLGIASSLGEYYFDSRQKVSAIQNNTGEQLFQDRTVYSKGFNVAGVPQVAHNLTLSYRAPDFWGITLTANYFDDIYIDFNPDRRTQEALSGLNNLEQPDLWNTVIEQENFGDGLLFGLFAYKSWRLDNGSYLRLSVSADNLLNVNDFRIGGFEQYRFDYENKDVNRFAPKYYYAFARQFFVNVSYTLP